VDIQPPSRSHLIIDEAVGLVELVTSSCGTDAAEAILDSNPDKWCPDFVGATFVRQFLEREHHGRGDSNG
jgi:hypothetical protein